MSGFKEGAGDVGRSAYANIGDTYQAFLRGETAPDAQMVADTVTTQNSPEIAQTYQQALLKEGMDAGLEAEADHWREYEQAEQNEADAAQQPTLEAPDISAPEPEAG